MAEVLEAFPYDKSVKVTLAAEDLVLGKLLGKMFGYRSKFDFGREGVSTSRSSTGLISVETLVELGKIHVIENIIEVKKNVQILRYCLDHFYEPPRGFLEEKEFWDLQFLVSYFNL